MTEPPLSNFNSQWDIPLFTDDLRDKEEAKIECGRAHFKALAVRESPARYVVARNLDDVLSST